MVNKELYFSNGISIPKPDTFVELREYCSQGHRIGAELISDDDYFRMLFDSWANEITLREYADYTNIPYSKNTFCLYAEKPNCEAFLQGYTEWVTYPDSPIVMLSDWESICKTVDQQIASASVILRTRVKWICGLMAETPENVFASGDAWKKSFVVAKQQQEKIVTDGTRLRLSPPRKKSKKLTSQILRNSGNKAIRVFAYNSTESVPIWIPAQSGLRMTVNEDGDVVSLKGALSRMNSRDVVITTVGKDGLAVSLRDSMGVVRNYPVGDTIWDAAPNGNGGLLVLTDQKLISNMDALADKEGEILPIQIYGSLTDWAWLYEDSTLVTSGGTFSGVTAVAECGVRIVFRDQEGVKSLRRGYVMPSTESKLLELWFERFQSNGEYAESVKENDTALISIDMKGVLCDGQ